MARAGVSEVYTESHELLEQMLCIDLSRTQVFRVTHQLGEQLESAQAVPVEQPPLANHEVVYGSMDGSMIQTELGWKEVKLGRVFRSSDLEGIGTKKRNRITDSIYSACLGNCQEFLPRFEASLGAWADNPSQLVFITDGAEWIRNYLQENYPDATHILDYFHAVERLGEFAKSLFKLEPGRTTWIDEQATLLKQGKVGTVLDTLKKLMPLNKTAREERYKLITYYQNNRNRMAYDEYRKRGLMIGSGTMEAAHRTVLQARMKRSGQHWKIEGAKSMINMRVALKSGRWQQAISPLLQAA